MAPESKGPPRSRGARREALDLRDPLPLVRALRDLADLADRSPLAEEFHSRRQEIQCRAAAQDPGWAVKVVGDDHECRVEGVRRVVPEEMTEGDRRLASLLDEVRRALHRLSSPDRLTASERDRLLVISSDLLKILSDPSFPLTRQEQRIWDLLLGEPEDRPLSCRRIVARLRTSGKPLSEENARRSLSTTLKAKGVRNRRGAGYFIPAEFRAIHS